MNIGREYTNGQGNAAAHDLFTTVVHEIGHALGLSAANNAYVAETGDLDVDIGRQHAQQRRRHGRPRRYLGVHERLQTISEAHAGEGANPVHGRTRSSAAPIRNAVTSSYVRATIWMPVGTPLDDATPLGTAKTGHAENTLNGVVM